MTVTTATERLVDKVVDELKGMRCKIGAVVGRADIPRKGQRACTLVRYEGDAAIVETADGTTERWPASEIVDVNVVKNQCLDRHVGSMVESMAKSHLN